MIDKLVPPRKFHASVQKLRSFFDRLGFIEVHTQSGLSILAACEDPKNVAPFMYRGEVWPLPQTGQMWLEWFLLTNSDIHGCYCVSTSFRDEPDPIPGRHDCVFPMFEFEMKGTMEDLKRLEADLLRHLGFGSVLPFGDYEDVARKLGVSVIDRFAEEEIQKRYGPAFSLERFPKRTDPFWNMLRLDEQGEISAKIDLILHGMETIGSAERSCDAERMRHDFLTISDGLYANLLFSKFGKRRVLAELNEFLSLPFFPRIGGGLGMTRMIRALELSGLLYTKTVSKQPAAELVSA